MKKIMPYTLFIALSGLLVSQISFAGYPNKNTISELCRTEAQQLNRLIERAPHDKCAGDVAVAAAYLDAAEIKVRYEHYDEALVSLHYSENELKQIAYARTYCAHFASLVKPEMVKVIKISSELEVLERMKLKNSA